MPCFIFRPSDTSAFVGKPCTDWCNWKNLIDNHIGYSHDCAAEKAKLFLGVATGQVDDIVTNGCGLQTAI